MTEKGKLTKFTRLGKPEHFQYVLHKGWTMGALRYVWKLHLEPLEDWRNRIRTAIPVEVLEVCRASCEFFTATNLQTVGSATPLIEGKGTVQVEAIGYRDGPYGQL